MFERGTVIYGLISVIIAYTVYRIIRWRYKLHILFKLPGPKRLPFLDNLIELVSVDSAGLYTRIRHWNQKYGPVYVVSALGNAGVGICGPDEFEVVASTMKHIEKGRIYKMLDDWLGRGLLTSTGAQWQQRRKILTPAFHFSVLQQFIEIFNNETTKLVERLNEEVNKSSTNVVPIISQTTLSAIAATSFGTKIDESNLEDKKYISSIHQLGDITAYRVVRPWFQNKNIFITCSTLGTKYTELLNSLHKFTNRIIERKSKDFKPFEIGKGRKKLTFLDLLLNAKITAGLIDDKGIKDEVNTFMFEGHDTTAMAISFALLLLANNKQYQDLLYEEIITVLGESNKQPDLNDLNELKLMERVIKESLRLYPSVPFISRTLETDVTLNGYFVPKETEVNVWIQDIHRNPKYWPDPDKFDPDRFLPENCIGRHPFVYVPFSAGPRNCIGQKFAMLELKAILCGILKNYIIDPVDTPGSVRCIIDIVLRTQNQSLNVKFRPREINI